MEASEDNGKEGEAAELASSDRGSVRLPIGLFYIERDPHSRMEKGERDTQVVRVNEATVAWPEATACHRPRRLSGFIRTHPPPIVHSHRQKSVIFRKSG